MESCYIKSKNGSTRQVFRSEHVERVELKFYSFEIYL